jgi:hypothetical protein
MPSTFLIMFSFQGTESGLFFVPLFDMTAFKDVFYEVNKRI